MLKPLGPSGRGGGGGGGEEGGCAILLLIRFIMDTRDKAEECVDQSNQERSYGGLGDTLEPKVPREGGLNGVWRELIPVADCAGGERAGSAVSAAAETLVLRAGCAGFPCRFPPQVSGQGAAESWYNTVVPKRLIKLLLLPFPFHRFQVRVLQNLGTTQSYQNV